MGFALFISFSPIGNFLIQIYLYRVNMYIQYTRGWVYILVHVKLKFQK